MVTRGLKLHRRLPKKGSKICLICKKRLSFLSFGVCRRKDRWHKGFYRFYKSYCKPCEVQRVRTSKLARRYGLSLEQFQAMKDAQDYKCYLCKKALKDKGPRMEQFCIDHCHATDKVRRLLCFQCNAGLGMFKDNPEVLHRASLYVKGDL